MTDISEGDNLIVVTDEAVARLRIIKVYNSRIYFENIFSPDFDFQNEIVYYSRDDILGSDSIHLDKL